MAEEDTLKKLQDDFLARYQKSLDKGMLLSKEIKGCESLFDFYDSLDDKSPGDSYYFFNEEWDYFDVLIIREFYFYTIIEGCSYTESEPWLKNLMKFAQHAFKSSDDIVFYYNLTRDYFEYFKWLKELLANEGEPIIQSEYLGLIFDSYKFYFDGETKESWIKRFIYPSSQPIKKILISEEAREKSSKLILLAILDKIQDNKTSTFDFDDFVSERFGIDNFSRAKNQHRNKMTFKEVSKKCEDIFRK